jgi:ABC-type transport system substrate-binding protein
VRQKKAAMAVFIALGFIFSLSPLQVTGALSEALQQGPYVNEVVFKVIENLPQRVLALQEGEIDLDTSFFNPLSLPLLMEDPDITTTLTLRNGYGHLTINCDSYPLNISAFRRAFAFAFDKNRVRDEVMNGQSVLHDSLIPPVNPWCIEDDLEPHYYDAQPEIGNAILDQLGFPVNSSTGYRVTPSGRPFHITVGYGSGSIATEIAQIAADALQTLHIDSRTYAFCCGYPMWEVCDISFYATNFNGYEVDWLAEEYWSENAEGVFAEPNGCNFRNSTYDAWREQLLHATTYEEVHEATSEMQKILHHNIPRLVVYVNYYMQAYRNGEFTGHVNDLAWSVSGTWTLRKIHRIDGTEGGTVSIAISGNPDTFNIFLASSVYSAHILEQMYCSLYDRGPGIDPVPDLATSLLIQSHADNPAVPNGHTRFTIDIVQNATWSDGTPLTAEDVAFTFNYALESVIYENPAALALEGLVSSYAPSYYRVVFEFETESYLHFSQFAYAPIIPKHIFNNEDGIGYEDWASWNPILSGGEPGVWCGPFSFKEFEAGDFYTLQYNPYFYYRINRTETSVSSEGGGPGSGYGDTLTASAVVSSASVVVIVVFTFLTWRGRKIPSK